ncbi:hypothetical protein ABT120_55330 [Nonomuraea angiospora]|uniref:hypothetical protein n=1 Tax=Nonomuraea angiospora TaxID=46172 RepID=UPI00331BA8AF
MSNPLHAKVALVAGALVAGASSGIGEATAPLPWPGPLGGGGPCRGRGPALTVGRPGG